MSRIRYIYRDGVAYEAGAEPAREPAGPFVFGDTPSYQSPIDGRWIDGRKARREDLKRSGCVEYEPSMKREYIKRMQNPEPVFRDVGYDNSQPQYIRGRPTR